METVTDTVETPMLGSFFLTKLIFDLNLVSSACFGKDRTRLGGFDGNKHALYAWMYSLALALIQGWSTLVTMRDLRPNPMDSVDC